MARLDPTGVSRILTYIKTWITGLLSNKSDSSHTHSDYVPKSGGGVLTGVTFNRTTDNSYLSLCGSTDWDNGAAIALNGKDRTDNNGFVKIRAKDSSHVTELVLKPDGTATWGNKEIDTIEEQGDGYIRYSNGLQICWGVIRDVEFEPFNGHYGKLISYPKSFLTSTFPIVNISQWRGTGNLTQNFNMYIVTESYVGIETDNGWGVYYTVFGMWK